MDASLDKLFGDLRNATNVSKGDSIGKTTAHGVDLISGNGDVLQLENSEDNDKKFAEIERSLKNLPKLQNEFDRLIHGDGNNSENKSKGLEAMKIDSVSKPSQVSSKEWFTIPKMGDRKRQEVQRDLLLLKHRAALDPKRHYKKDRWKVPDRFSVGTIIEGNTEFYSSRLTKKQRKSTMLETLMADDDTNKYFKRKYNEIQTQKTSGKKGHYKKTKQLRHRK
ncbi:hypothetical protein Kpol_1011p15 [Vanderwaltozyma polyspora DSM 70294]|uniref:Fcf2 pre-rRNA processing C-terminal domain-containing protein n=1 Tax=Vanderwaltozyma polyspora (strain ATCC 22028 / DSM 70294 / BCRC 21397 / CBS 2163 / NBRC 10782 / NRRL Y-8283 / UCD 57-17) TaxID=436907 RepID=A7TQX0_VANPO|nr:uncharacterized protein Kpol_1011p15 [Vanderwaltozyma polyspora DSM 70294]EDO15343.1 hypothetical protein Kpol_1011p15 [Vanderwaltozyma polyspora DSM 70294]